MMDTAAGKSDEVLVFSDPPEYMTGLFKGWLEVVNIQHEGSYDKIQMQLF